jgi:hypothetical protein
LPAESFCFLCRLIDKVSLRGKIVNTPPLKTSESGSSGVIIALLLHAITAAANVVVATVEDSDQGRAHSCSRPAAAGT